MSEAGQALLGIGMGTGERRAMDAVEHAIESPLLETSLEGARSILLSVTGGRDLSLWEVNEAAKAVAEAAHPDANIIFGAMVDEKVEDQVWVTVVATGYGDRPGHRATPREGRIPADLEPRVRRTQSATAPGSSPRSTCPSSSRASRGALRPARGALGGPDAVERCPDEALWSRAAEFTWARDKHATDPREGAARTPP